MGVFITKKLVSNRGASLSLALLLFLVCTIISSIVLVAATASSGRLADYGEADARYYNVTSAVEVFEASLGSDRTCTYTSVQSRSGSTNVALTMDNPADDGAKGYDFLTPITCYALYGYDSVEEAQSNFDESAWYQEMTFPMGQSSIPFNYEVASQTASGNVAYSGPKVKVKGLLYPDWTLDLAFTNDADEELDQYSVHVLLKGTASSSAGEDVKHTTVTWTIVSIEPGEGLVA